MMMTTRERGKKTRGAREREKRKEKKNNNNNTKTSSFLFPILFPISCYD